MDEVWISIRDYEGFYDISNFGVVKGLARQVPWKTSVRTMKEKIMKYSIEDGYRRVGLCKGGHQTKISIHRMVAEAFIPNPLNLPEVNHIDGIKTNNVVTNLEWCTDSYNKKHAYDTGLKKSPEGLNQGIKHGMSKLVDDNVLLVLRLLELGLSQYKIAKIVGINQSGISRIKNNKLWHHIERK